MEEGRQKVQPSSYKIARGVMYKMINIIHATHVQSKIWFLQWSCMDMRGGP